MAYSIWFCPLCHSDFTMEEKRWYCNEGHSFDIAKQGYVNLLPAHQKNSLDPGDNKEMLHSRRTFLNLGFYQPLAKALATVLSNHENHPSPLNILDIGCGEGYFSHDLKQSIPNALVHGIDISKHAVQMAARTYKECEFVVASSASLPIKNHCLDVIVRNFAPSKESELERVLKSDGTVITVTPGDTHLHELRSLIYQKVEPYQGAPDFKLFTLRQRQELQFEMHFQDREEYLALCKMTPFYWKIPAAELAVSRSFPQTHSAHFIISEYRKCSDET